MTGHEPEPLGLIPLCAIVLAGYVLLGCIIAVLLS